MEAADLDVLRACAQWVAAGRSGVLVTVIRTWGSSPRPAGAMLAIRDDGLVRGSVSGGCIEGDVVTRALDTLSSGRPEVLEYGVSDAKAWEVGLACGGRIRVFVEPVTA
jgi:xanthine/CO dehydrogenase XdhC/CoxF family maturation factor